MKVYAYRVTKFKQYKYFQVVRNIAIKANDYIV